MPPVITGLARRRGPERYHPAAEVRSEYFYRPPVQHVSHHPLVAYNNSLEHRKSHEASRHALPSRDTDTLDEFDKNLLVEANSQAFASMHQRPLRPTSLADNLIPRMPLRTPLGQIIQSEPLPSWPRNTPRTADVTPFGLPLVPQTSSPTLPSTSPTITALHRKMQTRAASDAQGQHESRPSQSRTEDFAVSNVEINRIPLEMRTHNVSTVPVVQGIQLVPTSTLPDQLRSVFPFKLFNAVQSKCFAAAFETNDNIVISAPTGSGKTAIMEIAICKLVAERRFSNFKVIYQAPTKSLCAERYRDWQSKFTVLSLRCAELTGDTDIFDLSKVQSADIIITTPEKWDSITRKWKDHAKLMQMVKLFLVDEVHILKESRGATLEAVVSRMKSVVPDIRFIALSATVPNSEDIAVWLGKSSSLQHLPAYLQVFGESFRPVQLRKVVRGFEGSTNEFAFEAMLTKRLPDIISRYSCGKPVMIFCSTRRAAMSTAKMLAGIDNNSKAAQNRLWSRPHNLPQLQNPELNAVILAGVAFHHGGLAASDRRTVEDAFLNGQIGVICSTSTLAVGVNLPCYLVILKGTTHWTDNGIQEYGDLEVMQMLGRAGRPQFESSACAVILTQTHKVGRYEAMVSGQEILESSLHQNLIEHLNAEVGLGTVTSLTTAKQWLSSTFLYVRLKRNPQHYSFREDVEHCAGEDFLERLCEKDLETLQRANLIKGADPVKSTEYGDAMARYYVSFDTMHSFMSLPPKAKSSDILSVLSQASEFKEIRLLSGEKSFYKEINKTPEIRFPVKVDVALPCHKISLLIQAELGGVALPEKEQLKKHIHQHRVDRIIAFSHANRLMRCIIDCQILRKDSVSTRNALELGRSLAAHVWDNNASQLRQLDGLGEVSVRKLASRSINSIETLLNTEPSRIEIVLGKNPPFGLQLLKQLESFPNLRVSIKETGRELENGKAVIRFIVEIGFLNEKIPQFYKKRPVFVCCLTETADDEVIDFRKFKAARLQGQERIPLMFELIKPTTHIKCFVMCDEVAGTSKSAELSLSTIPGWVFPHSLASTGPGSGPPLRNQRTLGWTNDFDNGGVDDNDLLALEIMQRSAEVVEDIDEILERQLPLKKSVIQPHLSGFDPDTGSTVYRKPQQLENGRWACLHDCMKKGRRCKHKCCREGVAKPKQRSKPESDSHGKHQSKLVKPSAANLGGTSVGDPAMQQFSAFKPRKWSVVQDHGELNMNQPMPKRLKVGKERPKDSLGDVRRCSSRTGLDPDDHLSSEPDNHDDRSPEDLECEEEGRYAGSIECNGSDRFSSSTQTEQVSGYSSTIPTTPDAVVDLVTEQTSDTSNHLFLSSGRSTLEITAPSMTMTECQGRNAAMQDTQADISAVHVIGEPETAKLDRNIQKGAAWMVSFSEELKDLGGTASVVFNRAESGAGKELAVDAVMVTGITSGQGGQGPTNDDINREGASNVKATSYEEDQRVKWKGIDKWLYDEVNEYVELI